MNDDEEAECGHKNHRYGKVLRCLDCEDFLRARILELEAQLAPFARLQDAYRAECAAHTKTLELEIKAYEQGKNK